MQVNRPISAAEGHFIAGFIEGEGHFGLTEANGGQSFQCLMGLRLRDDDARLITWLRERTGVGTLRPVAAQSTAKPQVEWRVQTQAGCRVLVDLLTRFPPRGRKRLEFEIWAEAVELWNSGSAHRAVLARRLRRELDAVRRFRPPSAKDVVAVPDDAEALRAYFHGFFCAEGSLGLGRSRSSLAIHLRQDDRPLLEMFERAFGVGHLRDERVRPPDNPSTSWQVARLDDVVSLASWLTPEHLRGRKAVELEIWLRGVAERREARARGRLPEMEPLLTDFRAARRYRPGAPLPPATRTEDARAATLEVLRRWSQREVGCLSTARYAAARQPGWPNRNTITRRFGSWDAALCAAGLADRVASTAEQRAARAAGGAARREARATAQRERVLQTLRYLIVVHGRVPTAMQFFRWRLIEAPATPTQATVYRLFPGGWQAVLDAIGPIDPRVLCEPSPTT